MPIYSDEYVEALKLRINDLEQQALFRSVTIRDQLEEIIAMRILLRNKLNGDSTLES